MRIVNVQNDARALQKSNIVVDIYSRAEEGPSAAASTVSQYPFQVSLRQQRAHIKSIAPSLFLLRKKPHEERDIAYNLVFRVEHRVLHFALSLSTP